MITGTFYPMQISVLRGNLAQWVSPDITPWRIACTFGAGQLVIVADGQMRKSMLYLAYVMLICIPLSVAHGSLWLLHAVFQNVTNDILLLSIFPAIVVVSGIVSYNAKPENERRLRSFYQCACGRGLHRSVHDKVMAARFSFTQSPGLKRHILNVVVGIVLPYSLVAIPIFFVIKERDQSSATGAVALAVGAGVILKKMRLRHGK